LAQGHSLASMCALTPQDGHVLELGLHSSLLRVTLQESGRMSLCCDSGRHPCRSAPVSGPHVTYLTPNGAFRVLHLLPPQALDTHVAGLAAPVAQAPGQHGGCTGHGWGQGRWGRGRDRVTELGVGLG
jgi:hypothetical protein